MHNRLNCRHDLDLSNCAGLAAYKWIDGTRFSYQNWSRTEPSCRSRFNCCAVNLDTVNGTWFDLPCGHSARFVCQRYLSYEANPAANRTDLLRLPDNYLMRFEQDMLKQIADLKANVSQLYDRINSVHGEAAAIKSERNASQTMPPRYAIVVASLLIALVSSTH